VEGGRTGTAGRRPSIDAPREPFRAGPGFDQEAPGLRGSFCDTWACPMRSLCKVQMPARLEQTELWPTGPPGNEASEPLSADDIQRSPSDHAA
jgi:hypothetical protein